MTENFPSERSKAPVGWLGSYAAMAQYAGVSKRMIARWINHGDLQVRHLSARKVLCRPSDLDKCIENLAGQYELSRMDY